MTDLEFVNFLSKINNGAYREVVNRFKKISLYYIASEVAIRCWLDKFEDEDTEFLRMTLNGYLATGYWGFMMSGRKEFNK